LAAAKWESQAKQTAHEPNGEFRQRCCYNITWAAPVFQEQYNYSENEVDVGYNEARPVSKQRERSQFSAIICFESEGEERTDRLLKKEVVGRARRGSQMKKQKEDAGVRRFV